MLFSFRCLILIGLWPVIGEAQTPRLVVPTEVGTYVFIDHEIPLPTGSSKHLLIVSRHLPDGKIESEFGRGGSIAIPLEDHRLIDAHIFSDGSFILLSATNLMPQSIRVSRFSSEGYSDILFGDLGTGSVELPPSEDYALEALGILARDGGELQIATASRPRSGIEIEFIHLLTLSGRGIWQQDDEGEFVEDRKIQLPEDLKAIGIRLGDFGPDFWPESFMPFLVHQVSDPEFILAVARLNHDLAQDEIDTVDIVEKDPPSEFFKSSFGSRGRIPLFLIGNEPHARLLRPSRLFESLALEIDSPPLQTLSLRNGSVNPLGSLDELRRHLQVRNPHEFLSCGLAPRILQSGEENRNSRFLWTSHRPAPDRPLEIRSGVYDFPHRHFSPQSSPLLAQPLSHLQNCVGILKAAGHTP